MLKNTGIPVAQINDEDEHAVRSALLIADRKAEIKTAVSAYLLE